jgi:hypothetical protein
MKSQEEENQILEELKKFKAEEKFFTLEEFQKFNPFHEREKERLEFSDQRRLLRDSERSNITMKQDENINTSNIDK